MNKLKVMILSQPWQKRNEEEFSLWVKECAGRAKLAGAKLLVLPTWTGMQVLLYHHQDVDKYCQLTSLSTEAIISNLGFVLEVCGEAAANHGLFLVTGSLLNQREGLKHSAFLIGPDGRVLLEQGQTHVTAEERQQGLRPDNELFLAETPWGKLGFLIGRDIYYPEVSRILGLMGADMVVALEDNQKPYTIWQQLRGLWREVQQNQFFGIEAGIKGALLAPCEITCGNRGIIKEGLDTIIGELDLRQLNWIRRQYPLEKFLNKELYKKELPGLYEVNLKG